MAQPTSSIEQAHYAADRGAWHEAFGLLANADEHAPLDGAELPFFAAIAYAAGNLDRSVDAWERAHAESLRAGDRVAAAGAAVRVAMHLSFDTALMAPVRGWLARAERLLEGRDETGVHAWIAVVTSYERLLSGDFAHALACARRAIDIGSRLDPAAAAIARVAEARSLIVAGRVDEGVPLLREAGAAAASGALDPLLTGMVYCEVVCALQGLAHYDLAEQWTASMERWCRGQAIGSIHGRCRVHRAELLRLRGRLSDAEQHAIAACEELRPYLHRELGWPLTELGLIRLRKGDLDEAEAAFVDAHDVGWDPQPGLALVQLAAGDIALATETIRDALEHPLAIPSKELPPRSDLRRAPLLAAQVEIAIAGREHAVAQRATDELASIADAFATKPLRASVAYARGRVRLATGNAACACVELARALRHWTEIGAPYEAALARLYAGSAFHALGNDRRAKLELAAAERELATLGAARDRDTAARLLAEVDSPDVHRAPTAPPAGHDEPGASADIDRFHCDGDHWTITFGGHTVQIHDRKGLHYLARLLASPGRSFHVLELATDQPELDAGDAGPVLDVRAKRAYRRRLAETDEDIADAEARGDAERAEQAHVERELLARELTRAVGLGDRDRQVNSTSERARASVTRAIRQAIARIREHHPLLGAHLDRTIRTGTTCDYLPDPRMPITWMP